MIYFIVFWVPISVGCSDSSVEELLSPSNYLTERLVCSQYDDKIGTHLGCSLKNGLS
jgi:hypothetical protein